MASRTAAPQQQSRRGLLLLCFCACLVQSGVAQVLGDVFLYEAGKGAGEPVHFDPFPDLPADFGPEVPDEGIDGLLLLADPEDACQPLTNRYDDEPWVALISRSQHVHPTNCTFDVKVHNAELAGASAAIVYDDVYEALIIMSKPRDHPEPGIPAVFVSEKAGIIMRKLLTPGVTRVRIVPVSASAWMSLLMSAFLGFLALTVVLATFYVMRSWSMWLGRTRRRGMAPELAGFGAAGAQVGGQEGLPACAIRALPILIYEGKAGKRRRSSSTGGAGAGKPPGDATTAAAAAAAAAAGDTAQQQPQPTPASAPVPIAGQSASAPGREAAWVPSSPSMPATPQAQLQAAAEAEAGGGGGAAAGAEGEGLLRMDHHANVSSSAALPPRQQRQQQQQAGGSAVVLIDAAHGQQQQQQATGTFCPGASQLGASSSSNGGGGGAGGGSGPGSGSSVASGLISLAALAAAGSRRVLLLGGAGAAASPASSPPPPTTTTAAAAGSELCAAAAAGSSSAGHHHPASSAVDVPGAAAAAARGADAAAAAGRSGGGIGSGNEQCVSPTGSRASYTPSLLSTTDDEDGDGVPDVVASWPGAAAAGSGMGARVVTGGPVGARGGATRHTCVVCLERYASGDKVRVLPCQHRFHAHCIDPWLSARRLCPVCKHDASTWPSNSLQAALSGPMHLDSSPALHHPVPTQAAAAGGGGGAGAAAAVVTAAGGGGVDLMAAGGGVSLLLSEPLSVGMVSLGRGYFRRLRARLARASRRRRQQQQQQEHAVLAGVGQQDPLPGGMEAGVVSTAAAAAAEAEAAEAGLLQPPPVAVTLDVTQQQRRHHRRQSSSSSGLHEPLLPAAE